MVMDPSKEHINTTNQPYRSSERLLWWSGRQLGAAERLAELGYTGLIVPKEKVEKLCGKEFPLWVHLKAPDSPSFDEEYPDLVWEKISSLPEEVVGVLWEVPHRPAPTHRDQSDYDLLLRALQTVEAAVGELSLLFYPSMFGGKGIKRMATWLEDLAIDAAPTTSLAFSAVAGLPTDDHFPLHLFWKEAASARSCTRLLPILNVGCVDGGEGLWPTFTYDLVAECVARAKGNGFAGFVALAASIPKEGCVLDANLSIAAKALLTKQAPSIILEEWMEKQGWKPELERPVVDRVRQIQLDLRGLLEKSSSGDILDAEPQRVRAQSLLGQLNELSLQAGTGSSSLREALPCFVRDSKRLLYQYMQANNISIPNVFTGDDMQESFWTGMAGGNEKGLSFGAEATLLPEPLKGAEGSVMEKIYTLTYAGESRSSYD